ncbi:MAG TPA: hypothetical protein VF092_03095 [Longimicrobium sp.]
MQHLTLEALARLVDEAPLADEAAHLSSCLVCRRELGEMRAQTAALGALEDPEAPAGAWPALEAALRAEGLIVDVPRIAVARIPLWRRTSFLRAAAAVAIFVAGGAIGMMLRASGAGPRVASNEPALGPPMVARPPAVSAVPVANGVDGPLVVEPVDPSPNGARMASSTGGAPAVRRPADPAVRRARAELEEAEEAWVAALQRYAAIADPSSGADPGTRMAALERMIATTGAALERAPGDPVINGYHMAALREREALRRDLAAADKDWF